MKAVVKKRFRDKYTDEVYVAGSELELTPERCAEIRATDANLVVAVVEESEQTEEQPGTADPENEEQTAGQPGTQIPRMRSRQQCSRRQQVRNPSVLRSRHSRISNGERVCACILQQYGVEEMQGVLQGQTAGHRRWHV